MAQRTDVMISSTAHDLPEHRDQALDACIRQGMFPIMMEHLPPSDAEAVSASLKMVDEAEIYLGIFAYRYGYIPSGYDISVTEMEYNRAVERSIPRLIFIMDKTHPITPEQMGEGLDDEEEEARRRAKLSAFKKRLQKGNIVNYFTSPQEFRALAINGLSLHRKRGETGSDVHYVSDIPKPPEAYIAHPYTLMHASRLFGRREELNLLTDWVAKPLSAAYQARIMNIVAIGGMGKSALTWHWFNEIAPHEMKPLAGQMWWSFYESDAHFENFIIRALAYVTGRHHDEIRRETKPGEREDMLLRELDQKPYLLVLDGLERILIAYARMDAARLSDDDYDKRTANYIAGVAGLPEGAGEQFVGQIQLRKAADPHARNFLRKLALVKASRILVSTRLYPAELQSITGYPIPGSAARFLTGLYDDDALNLWRDLGVSGGRNELLRVFNRFDNYPLLIRALAGEVARFRRAPGDFDAWQEANPDFTLVLHQLRQEDTKSHVLSYALKDLGADRRAVLTMLAAFHAPAGYETLAVLMVKGVTIARPQIDDDDDNFDFDDDLDEDDDTEPKPDNRLFDTESDLDAALDELEQRGLIGWDRRANRYDLHPIVRGMTWESVGEDDRRYVYEKLRGHFESVLKISNWQNVNTLDDLTSVIGLYHFLVKLGSYDKAIELFQDGIVNATHFRLSAYRQNFELIEMLFPDKKLTKYASPQQSASDEIILPRLSQSAWQAWTLNVLALTYQYSGQPGRAAPVFRQMNTVYEQVDTQKNLSVGLCNLSDTLRLVGELYESESAACRALVITREQGNRFQEAISLYWWGLVLAARKAGSLYTQFHPLWHERERQNQEDFRVNSISPNPAEVALRRSIKTFQEIHEYEGVATAFIAQSMLWRGDFAAARELAKRAWELAHINRYESDFIQSARLHGSAALGRGDFETASERLYHALIRARAVNRVEEELAALVEMAELARRQNNPDEARRLLDDVWDAAERGPYPLFHADALNVLAQIERDAGNHDAAVAASTQAYQKAWCDGPPFAYHWGLEKAKAHLDALGAAYPDMPPFDESQYEPMPEVEIDPPEGAAG